jgi:uncharacterized protein (DUF2141 family)
MNLFISILSLLWMVIPVVEKTSESNVISITVKGIKSVKGNVRIGVFNSSKGFPVTGNQYKGYEFAITEKQQTFKLYNIPKGNYAVGLFHDLNANKKMDKNILGMPLEAYGFSNDARGTFSAPSYESARFYHDGNTSLTINIY